MMKTVFTTKTQKAHYGIDLTNSFMAAQPTHFSALGRALVQQGRLQQADANAIQLEATKAGIPFVQQLVQSKKLSAREVSQFAASTFGYPLLDLNAVDLEHLPLNLL